MSYTCIYCKEVTSTNEASGSHIIPAALGGFQELRFAVCRGCNGAISREVETPFKDAWAWLICSLDIRGRRGKPPPFKAQMNLAGQHVDITIRSPARPPEIPPIFVKGVGVHLVGPRAYVETKMREFQKKQPNRVWTEQDTDDLRNKEIAFPINVDALDAIFSRRLAAKIAFESWAKRRSPKSVLGSEYDSLREFIRWGRMRRSAWSGLIADETIITKNIPIPFPCHAVSFIAHPSESILGSVVVLFGLFYYGVILNFRYPLIASISELTLTTPLLKKSANPVLTAALRPPRIPWERIIKPDRGRIQRAWRLAVHRLKDSGFLTGG